MSNYKGILCEQGKYITAEQAFDYAMERINADAELKAEYEQMVVDWFYSGNWVEEREDI